MLELSLDVVISKRCLAYALLPNDDDLERQIVLVHRII